MAEQKKNKSQKPNTKTVPIVITLAAAFISCLMSILQHVEFQVFTMRLLVTVVIFLVLGTIAKLVLDYSFKTFDETPLVEEESLDASDETEEDSDSEGLDTEDE